MPVVIRVDTDAAIARLRSVRSNVPLATAIALTRTATRARDALQAEMRRAFDRPTPYTLRSVYVKPATPADLEARVGLKDQAGAKASLSPAELLAHHFRGGARKQKRLEQLLARIGLISATERVVPGAGAKLDRYGNMNRGQIQQMLSQIRAGADPSTYRSASTRSRRNVRRAGRIFWSRGGRLARGAWIDQGDPIGVRPLLVVVSGTSYRRVINLPDVVGKVVAREFGPELARQLSRR